MKVHHPVQRRFLIVLFIALVSFGGMFFGYVVTPPKKPSNPPDVLFTSPGGPVLFPHAHHSSSDGAAINCSDCHHNSSGAEDTASEMNCRKCHYEDRDLVETVCADDKTHPRCIGKQCMSCHDGEDCTFCHRKGRK